MADDFDNLDQQSNPSDALSDVTTGMNITLLAVIFALVTALVVIVSLFVLSTQALQQKEVELAAETQAKELAVVDSRSAKQKAVQAEKDAKKTRSAMNQLAGLALSDDEINTLADLPRIRQKLKDAQRQNTELRSQVVRLSQDLSAAQGEAASAASQAAKAEKRAKKCEDAQVAGGDPSGNRVSAGLVIKFDDEKRRAYLVNTQDDESIKSGQIQVRYVCTTDTSVQPFIYRGGGGGGSLRSGGAVGK